MTLLILAIVLSTVNHVLFKAFARWRINLLHAIVANYAVCVAVGSSASLEAVFRKSLFAQAWYPFAIAQGGIFVGCLILMGRVTEQQGVAVASLVTRLSVAIPTVTAFLLYDDVVTANKIMGILAALLALYLSSGDLAHSAPRQAGNLLPILLFATFGAYSTLLKFVQARYLESTSYHAYLTSGFVWAFLISGAILAWSRFKKPKAFRWRDLIAGLALGCANYGSIYYLIRALSIPGWQSSRVFPTVSIAVVGLSSLCAWALFREKLHRRMLEALAIGVVSIVLINL